MSQYKLLMYESGLHFDVSSGDKYYNRHKKYTVKDPRK